jgi:CheY-like chemotaxis protein
MAVKKRVTVVNDNAEFLALMSDFLVEEGYDVTTLPKHQGAFEQIKESRPDIVICDLMFGTLAAGWALIDMLHLDPDTRTIPVILCTVATKEVQEVAASLAAKGIVWLEKPFELERLLDTLSGLDNNPVVKIKRQAEAKPH